MSRSQILIGTGCGALAGFVTGLLYFFVLLISGEYGSFGFLTTPMVGIIAGGVIGANLVRFRRKEVQQRRYWRGMGILLGILAMSPKYLVFFVVLLFALADETEYGPPIVVLGAALLYIFIGGLVGGVGGQVGGMVFTRLIGVQAEEQS